VTTIFAGAFAFGVGFDVGVTNLWDSWNRGVRCNLPSFVSTTHSRLHTETMEGYSAEIYPGRRLGIKP
jgi:hypothetical protein